MKFLCDQMLARLGRWLRAAGYDTEIVTHSIPDREVVEWAHKDNRLILTRDRHFLSIHRAEGLVIFLKANHLRDCIPELMKQVPINWLQAPFSRCLLCNQVLSQLEQTIEFTIQVPKDVLEDNQPLWFCSHCQKVYWEGSHTKRMRSVLQAWQEQSMS